MEEINIGIDVGGTHTDLTAISGLETVRAKALTTHENYSKGIFDALTSAAEQLSLSLEEMMSSQTRAFVNGNTIVTNAITELKGSKVGVLTSAGFGDICRFGRGNRGNFNDDQLQRNLPQIVSQNCIVEVSERIDKDGKILVALKEEEIREKTEQLLKNGVEAIAICFLWSTSNEQHEKAAQKIIQSLDNDIFITCSVDTASIFREFERWMTAILNCFVQPSVSRFAHAVSSGLRVLGYQRKIEFFNGLGGILAEEEVKRLPIQMYSSGPAGGAIGASALGKRYNIANLLCGDMGGTSFDTTLIKQGKPIVAQRCKIGSFNTAISLLDIVSVGAGGGSIVSLDPRGVPKIGPESAGSEPGPVCYGKGGKAPTITDCIVSLGILRPDNYLGGKHQLNVNAAKEALETHVAKAMGWNAMQAAAGAYNLVVANMANALRGVSIRRGHDPRKCTFLAYGGALPIFAAAICRSLSIKNMIIPNQSSAFSAYGLLEADYIRRKSATLGIPLDDETKILQLEKIRNKLVQEVLVDLEDAGFDPSQITFNYGADMRYEGQLNEMYMSLSESDFLPSELENLRRKFDFEYENEFGPETAWKDSRLMLINCVVIGVAGREKTQLRKHPHEPHSAKNAYIGDRTIFLPDLNLEKEVPIFESEKIKPGGTIHGPAVIEVKDTTIYLPTDAVLSKDQYINYRIKLAENRKKG